MNTQKMLHWASIVILLAISLGGCSAPTPIVIVVTATSQSTPTSTLIPPTSTITPTLTPLPPAPTLQIGGKYPIIQFENELGIEASIEVGNIYVSDNKWGAEVIGPLLSSSNEPQFVIRMGDGFNIIAPLRLFRHAYADSKGGQRIILADGREITGLLDFIVYDPNTDKYYDLSSASAAVLISLPEEMNSTNPDPTQFVAEWQLHILKPIDIVFSVSNARFIYTYFSTEGYLVGGQVVADETQSFYFRVGDNDILANISDFDEISFPEYEENANIDKDVTVKAKNGTETKGILYINLDSYAWYLICNSVDSEMVFVLKTSSVLTKASN